VAARCHRNEGGDAIVTSAVDAALGWAQTDGQVIKIANQVMFVFATNP